MKFSPRSSRSAFQPRKEELEQALTVIHSALEDYSENNIRSDKQARKNLDAAWNTLNWVVLQKDKLDDHR